MGKDILEYKPVYKNECSSYFLEGIMRGIEVIEIETFTSVPISDDVYIEDKYIVTVKGSDDQMATFKTQGISWKYLISNLRYLIYIIYKFMNLQS